MEQLRGPVVCAIQNRSRLRLVREDRTAYAALVLNAFSPGAAAIAGAISALIFIKLLLGR